MIKYIVFLIVLLIMAILSREHYSKYKGINGGIAAMFFYGMAETIYTKLEDFINLDMLVRRVRKLYVVSPKKAYEIAKEYIIKSITCTLLVVFFGVVLAGIVEITRKEDGLNLIKRSDYQGNTKEEKISLDVDNQIYEYMLQVEPVEYSKEEFEQKASDIFLELESQILGNNTSLDSVTEDLELVTVSDDGEFTIRWESGDTDYISSYGKIEYEQNDLPKKTFISATICYLEYEQSHTYNITICRKETVNKYIQSATDALDKLEINDRTSKEIVLPSEIDGVKVSLVHGKTNTLFFIIIGIVVGVALIIFRQEKLKENVEKRDQELLEKYPVFVNKMWLLIGTGMNIKDALIRIVKDNREKDILEKEIMYTINQIESGYSEFAAYEELGARLGLAPYSRIMNRISQNIRKGNKDLRKLMEEEVFLALNERRECVKKKGEEASTKMLFPMIILLGIVMVIVMFPALSSF